jgi:twitching motility protein PilT
MAGLEDLIALARMQGASDVHIAPGVPVHLRVDGSLRKLEDSPLSADACQVLAREAAGSAYERFERDGEVDLSATIAETRCRLNVFRVEGGCCIAVRLLADTIPDLASLGVPDAVEKCTSLRKGLVLVTGETGSGKSTTLASMIDRINNERACHIITLEDPIEYLYHSAKSLISQREVGRDTESFASGLRAMLREDPDVILVGEMRDLDTIETALTAAETGHLVFGTLHTQSAADSVDRLIGAFPAARQPLIRSQLSMTLRAVLSQQLLPRLGGGRVLAAEMMVVTPAVRNLIREGKISQIENSIATSASVGSISMDAALSHLVSVGAIDPAVAREAATDPASITRRGR